jgi:hypothetical protein
MSYTPCSHQLRTHNNCVLCDKPIDLGPPAVACYDCLCGAYDTVGMPEEAYPKAPWPMIGNCTEGFKKGELVVLGRRVRGTT